jgi:pimeloyl-ACP methyl ester carboxylesterase
LPEKNGSDEMRVLFAHGFEGGPLGSKPTYMRDELGWEVTSPVMSELGWDIESQTRVLLNFIDDGDYDLVIGSSMGGLAAANASSMRRDSDFRLLLIAPAFGLSDSWEGLSEDELGHWKKTGKRTYRGFEIEIELDWNFMEAAKRMSWPEVAHPTTIIHGSRDEVVSLSVSEVVADVSELVDLVVIEDGHRMKGCLPMLKGLASALVSR